jgi:MFS family permease
MIEYRKSSVRAANPGRRLNAFAVQRIITAYTLAFGGLLLGGRVSDRLGSHKALLIGAIGFAGSSAQAGAAPTFAVPSVGHLTCGAADAGKSNEAFDEGQRGVGDILPAVIDD